MYGSVQRARKPRSVPWCRMTANEIPSTGVEPHPAASVVLLRDGTAGPEILYLRRNPNLRFMGGYWVFPGGRVDAADYTKAPVGDLHGPARQAAVREAAEESGVHVNPTDLHLLCQWTTPTTSPIRFATWFFAALCPTDTVRIDGVEIHEHRWQRPEDALRAHQAQELKFANPTFALSTRFSGHATARDILAFVDTWPLERMLGRIHPIEGGRVALYAEDCGYESGEIDCPGPHHRIWMRDGAWRYERAF